MPSVTQVTCDGCGEDITYTGNCVDYRLMLGSQSIPVEPGLHAVTAAGRYPPVEHTHYFCGLSCLDHWTDRRRHREAAWRRYHKDNEGKPVYIALGGENGKRNEVDERIKAEALAAFPMQKPRR